MKTLLTAAALMAVTALPAAAFDPANMTDAEKAAFGEAVRDYIMANPNVLIEAVNKMEEQRLADEAKNDKLLVEANKAEIFEDLLAAGGYDRAASVAIGDGANDIGMIEAAGLGVAFCAKPALVAAADASLETRDLRAVIDLVAARADV